MTVSPWTEAELEAQLRRFGIRRLLRTRMLLASYHRQGKVKWVNLSLTLATASRESGIENSVGDFGHGRGVWQQDDRWNAGFLRTHVGCRDGEWSPCPRGHRAIQAGHVPTLRDGMLRFLGDLDEHRGYARVYGVGQSSQARFALASYNCGPGSALAGYRHGDVDRFTANHDYSADTMRRAQFFHGWLRRRGIR